MAHVFLNIGSNLGNRRLNISKAIREIEREFGAFELSHIVESDPQGFDSTNSFLNIGMRIVSDLPPLDVLKRLQSIEKSLSSVAHRNQDNTYKDRELDIDIVAIDDLIIDSEALTVPHPKLSERIFFLGPLNELAPGWRDPRTGKNPTEMLADLYLNSPDK